MNVRHQEIAQVPTLCYREISTHVTRQTATNTRYQDTRLWRRSRRVIRAAAIHLNIRVNGAALQSERNGIIEHSLLTIKQAGRGESETQPATVATRLVLASEFWK